jgi:hypothetical protein
MRIKNKQEKPIVKVNWKLAKFAIVGIIIAATILFFASKYLFK